jgi:hypothetical protein
MRVQVADAARPNALTTAFERCSVVWMSAMMKMLGYELAIADKVDDFPSYEREHDPCAGNGDLNRCPGASSYVEA